MSHRKYWIKLTPEQRLARAAKFLNTGYYKLGKGGRDPENPTPFTGVEQCDCSGYVNWAVGYDRFQPCTKTVAGKMDYDEGNKGVWLDTSGIIADATRSRPVWYRALKRSEPVRPGDLVVYGDLSVKEGHVGMVLEVLPGFEAARAARKGWGSLLIIADCSPRRGKRKHAIQLRDGKAALWEVSGRAYFVRPLL